jgi:hypothetical protein
VALHRFTTQPDAAADAASRHYLEYPQQVRRQQAALEDSRQQL